MSLDSHATVANRSVGTPPNARPEPPSRLSLRQRRQIGVITLAAIGVFAFLRWLPTGTNLSHMDFRVDAKNPIDFCDPLNPQFIPVVAVPSPVSMTLVPEVAQAHQPVSAIVRLKTASGKPIAPADLLVVHTERLHLLIVDPTLTDYQHVHPTPADVPGEWKFTFTPKLAGAYRIFADFTPAATSRGLYASADLTVAGTPNSEHDARGTAEGPAPAIAGRRVSKDPAGTANVSAAGLVVDRDGFRFQLTPGAGPLRARTPIDLKFSIEPEGGGTVPMQPVMGAFAHLVAFDRARSGFAHLHPTRIDLSQPPDARHPTLDFKITIPQSGRYVIWAQVNLGGHEVFVPFWIEVA